MDARLQVTDSGGRRIVTLDKPVFLIGRRTAADLQLVNADVSREHAELRRGSTGDHDRQQRQRHGYRGGGQTLCDVLRALSRRRDDPAGPAPFNTGSTRRAREDP